MLETERLSLKVLRADKIALRRLAMAEGEPMSVVVRRILRDELKQRGFWSLTNGSESQQTQGRGSWGTSQKEQSHNEKSQGLG